MEENEKFNPGEIVYLKSGGPAMTVAAVEANIKGTDIVCVWFDVGNSMRNAKCPKFVLTKEKP